MWRRRRTWLTALVLAAIAGTAWLLLGSSPPEPLYQGKRLSLWLEDASGNSTVGAQSQAVEAIRTMGTSAVPSLIRMLHSRDSQLKLAFQALAEKQKLVRVRFERISEVHVRAAHGCSILQLEARPAIPALVELLPQQEESGMAADALVRIGPDGVQALTRSLTTTNAMVRYNIAAALVDIRIGPSLTNATPEQMAILDQEADIAVPALMKLLSNTNDPARPQAALTLGVLGVHPNIVVPALIATLQDADTSPDGLSSAMAAAKALARFGQEAKVAVPALVMALNNPSAGVKNAAAKALKKIDPEAAIKAGVK